MTVVFALVLAVGGGSARAAAEEPPVELAVKAGRTLRVALDRRIKLGRAGQPITGTLVEPVYSYDRVVIPAGARVAGHIEGFVGPPKGARARAIIRGDFTPLRHAVLRFDRLTLADGREMPLRTQVSGGYENVSVLAPRTSTGKAARLAEQVAAEAGVDLAALRGPGKMERLKDALVNRLPYHPQYLRKGTVFTAELLSPLDFGPAAPVGRAPAGELAPAGSVLHARLLKGLDSARSTRGTPVRAVLTQPLLSADGRLILPEGAEMEGEVTFSRAARHLHRNGQLRFLFSTVSLPGEAPEAMKASLHAAELSRGQRVVIDEEGGTSVTNTGTRFILPAIALLSLRSSLETEGADPGELATGGGGDIAAQGPGGFVGWGLLGAALSQVSRPVAVGLGIVGFARSGYRAVFGKGREVVIPPDTPIQLQLSPSATAP